MNTTAKFLMQIVGRKGHWNIAGVAVAVEILDARQVFNREDVLIRPVAGHGEVWVSASSIRLDGKPQGLGPVSTAKADHSRLLDRALGTCPKCSRHVFAGQDPVWTCRHNLSTWNQYYIKNDFDMESHDVGGCVHAMPLHGACYDAGNY
jgi:hypothetical protein